VIKKPGGSLADSFLEEGFVLNKSFGVGQPRRCVHVLVKGIAGGGGGEVDQCSGCGT
jgi:hypothetical protein